MSKERSWVHLELTKGFRAKIDEADLEWASQWNWRAREARAGVYVCRHGDRSGVESNRVIWLHRELLGLDRSDPRRGDHRNHDSLDNRRSNLRAVSNTVNVRHRRGPGKANKSGYLGVYRKPSGTYTAQITINRKTTVIGTFPTAVEAAVARDLYIEQHGLEHARAFCDIAEINAVYRQVPASTRTPHRPQEGTAA